MPAPRTRCANLPGRQCACPPGRTRRRPGEPPPGNRCHYFRCVRRPESAARSPSEPPAWWPRRPVHSPAIFLTRRSRTWPAGTFAASPEIGGDWPAPESTCAVRPSAGRPGSPRSGRWACGPTNPGRPTRFSGDSARRSAPLPTAHRSSAWARRQAGHRSRLPSGTPPPREDLPETARRTLVLEKRADGRAVTANRGGIAAFQFPQTALTMRACCSLVNPC